MIGHLFSSIPGKGFVEFLWQLMGLLDQRVDHCFRVLFIYLR
jgi:hypothetical protein